MSYDQSLEYKNHLAGERTKIIEHLNRNSKRIPNHEETGLAQLVQPWRFEPETISKSIVQSPREKVKTRPNTPDTFQQLEGLTVSEEDSSNLAPAYILKKGKSLKAISLLSRSQRGCSRFHLLGRFQGYHD